mmetsp:Transcript_25993/g.39508  ORF Transcript_25993/g.39508 Transcript_25993/m.39508 type:complete len:225 (-) Transcript_25993:66-740(-)
MSLTVGRRKHAGGRQGRASRLAKRRKGMAGGREMPQGIVWEVLLGRDGLSKVGRSGSKFGSGFEGSDFQARLKGRYCTKFAGGRRGPQTKMLSKPFWMKSLSKPFPINTIFVIRFSSFPQGSASASSETSITAWKTCLFGCPLIARMPLILKIVPLASGKVPKVCIQGPSFLGSISPSRTRAMEFTRLSCRLFLLACPCPCPCPPCPPWLPCPPCPWSSLQSAS